MLARTVIHAFMAVVTFSTGVVLSAAQQRTWTDSSGRFSVEAELVEATHDSVVLKKATGKVIAVPISRLSEADRRHLAGLGTTAAGMQPRFQKRLTPNRDVPIGEFVGHPRKDDAMFATLEVIGQPIRGTSEYGFLTIVSAKDNEGKELKLLAATARFGHDLRSRFCRLDSFFLDAEDTLKIPLLFDPPAPTATHLATVEGSLRLKYRDTDTLVVDDVLQKVNTTLKSPKLKRVGTLRVGKPPAGEVADVRKALIVGLIGASKSVVSLDLLDGKGKRISTKSSRFSFGRRTKWTLEAEQQLLPATKLQITLGGNERTLRVPFKFEAVALGQGGSERRFQRGGQPRLQRGGQRRLEGAKGQGRLCAFAFSPDGKTLAGGTGAVKHGDRVMAGGQVLLWDPQTGRLVKTLGDHGAVVTSLTFSGDGKTLASTSAINSLVKLWDMRTGKLAQTLTLTGTIKRWSRLVLSPDGEKLVVAVRKRAGEGVLSIYQVTVWDVATGKVAWTLPESTSTALAVSPDGKTLAAYIVKMVDRKMKYREIRLCSLLTGETAGTIDPPAQYHTSGLLFTPDSKTLIGLGRSIVFWDPSNGNVLRELKRGPRERGGSWAISADGRTMACAESSGEKVTLRDLASGHRSGQLIFEQRNRVSSVAFASDLKSFACRQNETPRIMGLTKLDPVQ